MPLHRDWMRQFWIANIKNRRLNQGMSYVSSYYHCVFSTKDRRPLITPQLRERLWPFLGGIALDRIMGETRPGTVESLKSSV